VTLVQDYKFKASDLLLLYFNVTETTCYGKSFHRRVRAGPGRAWTLAGLKRAGHNIFVWPAGPGLKTNGPGHDYWTRAGV